MSRSKPKVGLDALQPKTLAAEVAGGWARRDLFGLLAVVVGTFAVYAATCARTLTGEDCGELVAAAYTLGVAHPPGYPTWTLLAKAFTWIPIGEIAFRVALLSAVCGAATAGCLAAVGLRLTRSWPAALLSAVGFSFLRDHWSQAVVAEVYTLNTLLLSLCLLLLLRWDETKSFGRLNAFAFVFGLSLTNHLVMAGMAPVFLVFLLLRGFRLLKAWRELSVATACFLAGLTPYAYLLFTARRGPPVNWGDPSTLQALVDHVLRRQYTDGAVEVLQTSERFWSQAGVMLRHALDQGATPLLALGVIASVYLLVRRFAVGLLLSGATLASTWWLIEYVNFDVDFENVHANRLFFVPAYLTLTTAAACAFADGVRAASARLKRAGESITAVAVVAAGVLATPTLPNNWGACDYSGYRIVADYGRGMIESVALNAVLFPTSDHHTFPLLYMKYVEGRRPDVILGDKYGYVDPDLYCGTAFANGDRRRTRSADFRREVETWALRTLDRPVYFTRKHGLSSTPEFTMSPEGRWFRAWRNDADPAHRAAAEQAAWEVVGCHPVDARTSPLDFTARMILGDVRFSEAFREFRLGDAARGTTLCCEGADVVPLSKEVQNNHGSLLAENGRFEEAERLFQKAVTLDPDYVLARRNLATVVGAAGRVQEAETIWTELHFRDPSDIDAVVALGEIARKLEKWFAAADHLENAGKRLADYIMLRDAGLIRLLELKQPGRAKELLELSLRLRPDQPEIRETANRIVARKDPREGISPNGSGARDEAPGKREAEAFDPTSQASGRPSVMRPELPSGPPRPMAPNPFAMTESEQPFGPAATFPKGGPPAPPRAGRPSGAEPVR